MKKPKLLRVIGIVGLAIAFIGIAAFVVLRFGNKKTTNTPASSPIAQPRAEQLKMPTQEQSQVYQAEYDGFTEVQTAYNANNYKQAISLANKYVAQTSVDSLKKLQVYVICISAALDIKDTANKEVCYKGALAVVDTLTNEQDKKGWKQQLSDLYNGTPLEVDDNAR